VNDIGRAVTTDVLAQDDAPRSPDRRRPYEAPRVESGEAFEKVQLASGCNFSDPLEGCEPVCP
jgi:hypothetical protein